MSLKEGNTQTTIRESLGSKLRRQAVSLATAAPLLFFAAHATTPLASAESQTPPTPTTELSDEEKANKWLENIPWLKNMSPEERVEFAQKDINAFRQILKRMLSEKNFSLIGENSKWWQIINDDTAMKTLYGGGIFHTRPPSERRISEREEEISYVVNLGTKGFLAATALYRDGEMATTKLTFSYDDNGEMIRVPNKEIPPDSLEEHFQDLFNMPAGTQSTKQPSTRSIYLPPYSAGTRPNVIDVIGTITASDGTKYTALVNNGGWAESSMVKPVPPLTQQHSVAQ